MWPRLFLPVVTGLMVALSWPATSRSADDQDACRIGAVAPDEYRAIAAESAALPAVDWQEIHGDPLGVSEDLENRVAAAIRDRIHAVIAARESSDQKVAAMHAVLRSIGAESRGPILSTVTSAQTFTVSRSLSITTASTSTGSVCCARCSAGDESTSS
jgi:hypothetical protein